MAGKLRSTQAPHDRTRRERGEETLGKLTAALRSLIAEVGAHGVTHRNLARRAGVSLSATTYYFDSKRDMVRSTFGALAAELRATAESMVERFGGPRPATSTREDEVQSLVAFVENRLRADRDESLTLIEFFLALARDPEMRRTLESDRAVVRRFVVELMARSHSAHPEEDADLLTALVTGLMLENLSRGGSRAYEKRALAIAERVMGWVMQGERGAGAHG